VRLAPWSYVNHESETAFRLHAGDGSSVTVLLSPYTVMFSYPPDMDAGEREGRKTDEMEVNQESEINPEGGVILRLVYHGMQFVVKPASPNEEASILCTDCTECNCSYRVIAAVEYTAKSEI
jgi:hypothetical protein